MSSSSGEYIFSFNGWGIQDKEFGIMDNSDSLSLGMIPNLYINAGGPFTQGSLSLPAQKDTNQFLLLYWDFEVYIYAPDSPYAAPYHLYMVKIDKSGNSGLGKVIEKNIVLVSDTLANAGITATKHANGRDWWVVVPEIVSNRYHTLLIAGDSLSQSFSQALGVSWPPTVDVVSPSIFSNNGEKYFRFSDLVGLQIFDFDRCTGQFYDHKLMPYEFNEGYFSGFALSRNNRFAYISDPDHLYQYDLEANIVESTKILIDTYDGFMNPAPWRCNFLNPQLAADGKIYIGSWGGCKNIHIINNPERQGLDCNFRQHGIDLNTFHKGGLPNMPNYRLGPIDGSICDSLGIDNIPLAGFRYDKDTADFLKVDFTELSDYEPDTWLWDFGDGQTSSEKYPVHQYDSAGIYQVCLTVSNQNGSDTYCKTLQLSTSSMVDNVVGDIAIYYSFEAAQLRLQGTPPLKRIQIFDASGRVLLILNAPSSPIDVSHFVKGFYVWQAIDHNGRLRTGKFIKI